MDVQAKLATIADSIRASGDDLQVSVRSFLSWFGAQRRGYWIVEGIREALADAGLITEPDFETAYIDSNIAIKLVASTAAPIQPNSVEMTGVGEVRVTGEGQGEVGVPSIALAYVDPTHSISKLAAANVPPTRVTPTAPLAEAVTLMMACGYSQLPVMTSDREVKGIVTWASIGSRLALGRSGDHVRDFMETVHFISSSASIFQAVPLIVQHNCVLVRAGDNKIVGILTASDLSVQFQHLAQPFLLLGEIENHVRQMIGARFTPQELETARDPSDVGRPVSSAADLSFGEYIRLLENPDRWAKLNLKIDRGTFCKRLDEIRRVRNDVMHFDPDGILPGDKELLSDTARFLQQLSAIGVN